MSVLTAVCSPLPAARLLRGSVRCVGLFLFPHGGAASAQASPCREAAAAAAAVTTTKPRAPDGPPPCRRRLPPLSLPAGRAPSRPQASGSSDGAQFARTPVPLSTPLHYDPWCRAALVSVSQIRQVRDGRGTRPVITCASSQRRRDRGGARLGLVGGSESPGVQLSCRKYGRMAPGPGLWPRVLPPLPSPCSSRVRSW